jgi:predicted CoA-substrate-specific enzyme activase
MTLPAAIGIDAGSTTIKLVAIDRKGEVILQVIEKTEPLVAPQAERLLKSVLEETGASGSVPVVATGYGRKLIRSATLHKTEIACHAAGIYEEFQQAGTLVDIGGQDTKVIRLDSDGRVINFAMNDKCAAGTGRFLENLANRLNIPIEKLGPEALGASKAQPISSTCTVFAESEVISLLAEGIPLQEILLGLHQALISRLSAMVQALQPAPPIFLSGGGAKNPALAQLLENSLGHPIRISARPQFVGAYGAALIGLKTDLPSKTALPL